MTALPIFLVRAFQHGAIVVKKHFRYKLSWPEFPLANAVKGVSCP